MEMFGKSPEIHPKKWTFTMFSPVNSGRTRKFHTEETWKSENNPKKTIGVSESVSSHLPANGCKCESTPMSVLDPEASQDSSPDTFYPQVEPPKKICGYSPSASK
jgi:hypothetical protein